MFVNTLHETLISVLSTENINGDQMKLQTNKPKKLTYCGLDKTVYNQKSQDIEGEVYKHPLQLCPPLLLLSKKTYYSGMLYIHF